MSDEIPVAELLQQPVERASRDVALRLLDTVEKERDRLAAEDPEALHDFRVAVRRLRSWLKAFKEPLSGSVSGKHRDALREVAHATNAGRDAEVHLEWLRAHPALFRRGRRPGTEWLVARLESKRRVAAKALRDEVEGVFVPLRRTLHERLKTYLRPVRDARPETTFGAAIATRLREQADGLRDKLAHAGVPDDQEAAHAARIAAKHLRYLLEPVASEAAGAEAMITRLKGLQDVLGAVHDAHVFGAEVAEAMVAAATDQARSLSGVVLKGDARRRSVRRAQRDPAKPGLLAVARRLRGGLEESLGSFAADWHAGAADPFWADAEHAVASLRSYRRRSEEVERKYLLSGMPDQVKDTRALDIEQGYLPGKHLQERLRRVRNHAATRFYRTVKLGTGLVRTEIEEETTRAVFDRMWPLTKGRRLKKRRRRVSDGSLVWEIDEFAGRDLVLAEVELADRDVDVDVPKWLRPFVVREVTDDEDYQGPRLAR